MKKGLLVFCVILLTTGIPTYFLSGCEDTPRIYFTVTDLTLTTLNSNGEIIDTSFTSQYDNVFKRIDVLDFEYVNISSISPFMINTAYATSPIPPIAIQKFENFEIKALGEFTYGSILDSIHVGEDISDLFTIGKYYSTIFYSLDEFLQNGEDIYIEDGYALRLANRPHTNTIITFEVSITMTDGSLYIFNNEVLNIE